MSEFDHALAGLYKTFQTPPPKEIVGCFCCLDAAQRAALLAGPLGDLTGDQLSPYASSVFLTLGDVGDYRHFLPRILDLSAADLEWWPSPEVAIGALARAEWQDWPATERQVIETFLGAWLDRWASQELSSRWNEIDSLLCGVARAGLEVAPYLQRLMAPENLPGLRELAALNKEAVARGAEPENFWEDAPEAWRRMIQFLSSPAVRERLSA